MRYFITPTSGINEVKVFALNENGDMVSSSSTTKECEKIGSNLDYFMFSVQQFDVMNQPLLFEITEAELESYITEICGKWWLFLKENECFDLRMVLI